MHFKDRIRSDCLEKLECGKTDKQTNPGFDMPRIFLSVLRVHSVWDAICISTLNSQQYSKPLFVSIQEKTVMHLHYSSRIKTGVPRARHPIAESVSQQNCVCQEEAHQLLLIHLGRLNVRHFKFCRVQSGPETTRLSNIHANRNRFHLFTSFCSQPLPFWHPHVSLGLRGKCCIPSRYAIEGSWGGFTQASVRSRASLSI